MGDEGFLGNPEQVKLYLTGLSRQLGWQDWAPPEFSDDEIREDIIFHYTHLGVAAHNYTLPRYRSPAFKEDIIDWLGEVEAKAEKYLVRTKPRTDLNKSHKQHFFEIVEKSRIGPPRRRAIEQLDLVGIINKEQYFVHLRKTD